MKSLRLFVIAAIALLASTAFAETPTVAQVAETANVAAQVANAAANPNGASITINFPAQAAGAKVAVPPAAPVAAPAPAPAVPEKSVAAKANEWAELGTNLGTSMGSAAKAILHETKDATFGKDVSVVDGIDKFSKTDAGRFTMLAVGWKIMGKDALELAHGLTRTIFGIFLELVWIGFFIWFLAKFCRTYSVPLTSTGPFYNRVKTYKVVDDYSTDEKMGSMFIGTVVFFVISALIVCTLIT